MTSTVAASAAKPTLLQVDPVTLLVDVNLRSDTQLTKDFVASIKDLGVLVPIVAVRTPEGALRVRHGHRRTLAACQAGLPTMPVLVAGDDDADDAVRIVSQWAENEHRTGLTTGGVTIIRSTGSDVGVAMFVGVSHG